MDTRTFLLACVGALASGGCTTLPDLKAQLDASPVCCVDMAQMKFEPLPPKEDLHFTLGSGSPAFAFQTGKSYFAAFALPPGSQGKELQIQAYATGSTAFETKTLAQIFCPRVAFLDANKRLLSTEEVTGQFDKYKGFSGIMRGAGSGYRIPAGAMFAVVHSNPGAFGSLRARPTSGSTYMAGNALVIDRGGEYFYFPCAPTADARIRIM